MSVSGIKNNWDKSSFFYFFQNSDSCFIVLRAAAANLAGLARQRLQRLGITQVFGYDSGADWCTVTQSSRFFSHRRDRVSGRLAVCIWRAA